MQRLWKAIRQIIQIYWRWFITLFKQSKHCYGQRKQQQEDNPNSFPRHPPKPEWVKKEVIRLKALMPYDGHRKISFVFNRLYANKRKMTVGRTFVGYTIRNHHYDIQVLRRKLKHKQPKPIPKNLIWGMDLTGKTDTKGRQHAILGIVEHHSRACLLLSAIPNKSTMTLLRILFDLFDHHQKPKIIRTDNEAVFTSKLFRIGLWILGIKHQRTEVACPWQNGKVERFFGTLKEKLNQWEVDSLTTLNHSLHFFQFWYNHIRPHQYLDGFTPAEAWQEKTNSVRRNNNAYWFDEWEGLLTGYYLPP
jgi:putative transposase